jgi:hypothetical protein
MSSASSSAWSSPPIAMSPWCTSTTAFTKSPNCSWAKRRRVSNGIGVRQTWIDTRWDLIAADAAASSHSTLPTPALRHDGDAASSVLLSALEPGRRAPE